MTCQGLNIPVGIFGTGLLDQAPQPYTGLREITEVGWDLDSMIELKQTQGYPWTVLALIRSLTVNVG